MAVVGQQVHITGGSDHLIATKKAVVVDAERGIAVEVEKKVTAVDMGGGRIIVKEEERVTGAVIASQAQVTELWAGRASIYS
jgi:hypothetical protein